MNNLVSKRFICPCCGYPTLDEKDSYEICMLCDWEDGGQNDSDSELVKGGPNADYSLEEARDNFKKYLIMYEPNRDMRITGRDTVEEVEIKKQLMKIYNGIAKEKDQVKLEELYLLVDKLEDRLYHITSEKIKEYENKIKGK